MQEVDRAGHICFMICPVHERVATITGCRGNGIFGGYETKADDVYK